MKNSLIKKLKCIDCNNPRLSLTLFEGDKDTKIKCGTLTCNKCSSIYPIYDYVPILISNNKINKYISKKIIDYFCAKGIVFHAKKKINKDAGKINNAYNWDFQWEKNADLFNKKNYFFSEESYLKFIKIQKDEYNNKDVLVIGTGYGKELNSLINFKCKNIFALDSSSVIFFTNHKYSSYENIHCIMADIDSLPFSIRFDIVVADHVLSRLTDIKTCTDSIIYSLKKKGKFAADVFSYENNFIMHKIIEPFKKKFLKHLPLEMLFWISLIPALLCKAVIQTYKVLNRVAPEPAKKLPLNEHFMYWSKLPFLWLWKGVIFDLLQAPIAHYLKKYEIEQLFPKTDTLLIEDHSRTEWCFVVTKN